MLPRPVSVARFAKPHLRDSVRAMTRLAPLIALPVLLLSACGSSNEQPPAPPVTQEETEALEDAASMLDEQRMAEETPEPDTAEGDSE